MDNLTHSLIGVATACVFPAKRPAFKKALLLTAVVGNNIPDIDIVLNLWGRLEGLVHHRGYTHSIGSIPVLGVASAWIGKAILTKLSHKNSIPEGFSKFENNILVLCGMLSVVLHIFADSWNSYGVHPFSPFYNGWFYGDSIFIVEPLLMLALLPLAREAFQRRSLSNELIVRKRTAITSFFAVALVLSGFMVTSRTVKNFLRNQIELSKSEKITDIALMPTPTIVFPWRFTMSTEGQSGETRIYTGRVDFIKMNFQIKDLHLQQVSQRELWQDVWGGSCDAQLYLRFSRFPILNSHERGYLLSDARFIGRKGLSFANVFVSKGTFISSCPSKLVYWETPFLKHMNEKFP